MLTPQSSYREQAQLSRAFSSSDHSPQDVRHAPWAGQIQGAAAQARKFTLRWHRLAVLTGIMMTSLLLWWALVRELLALVPLIR
jgi:hypothetical protein